MLSNDVLRKAIVTRNGEEGECVLSVQKDGPHFTTTVKRITPEVVPATEGIAETVEQVNSFHSLNEANARFDEIVEGKTAWNLVRGEEEVAKEAKEVKKVKEVK